MLGHLVKLHCDYLSLCFKLFSIIVNSNVCNWILIIFLIIWRFFFNGVSRFCMYISSGIRKHTVSEWWFKCYINDFIISVSTKWNWNRYSKKIIRHSRSISVLFANFVKSTDSVGRNGISNIFCQMLKWWGLADILENIISSN